MTIHELLAAAGLNANDEIPIWDVDDAGEPTKKITAQNLATAIKVLADLKSIQSAVSDPSASGTAVAFIDSISQNAQGVITPTKKTVAGATQSAAGLMSAADKTKLDVVILSPSSRISIPSAGNSVSYNLTGLTSDHVLTHWNFSSSAENAPPANLNWTTYNGYFTITNSGGTTSETIKPVFELPAAVTISAR